MTVLTELCDVTQPWTGVETSFAPGFPARDLDHVKVEHKTAAGVVTALTRGLHYSATLASGTRLVTVTPIALPAAPADLRIYRRTSATHTNQFVDGNSYPQTIHEDIADRDAMRSAENRRIGEDAAALAAEHEVRLDDFAGDVAAVEAARIVCEAARAAIQIVFLGRKDAFPVVDDAGGALQPGAWFSLSVQVGINPPGPYVWTGTGWDNLGTAPESLPRGDKVMVTDAMAASGIVPLPGGYLPGYVTIWRNGLKQVVGATPGTGVGDPNCSASDGINAVFPADVLAKNNIIEFEYRRAFLVADIAAADVSVTPAGGIVETNVQAALQGLDTRVAAVTVSADEGQFELVVTAAAGALTVALKTVSGADPTPTAPLVFPFPDGLGGIVKRQITAAFARTIPSGATLGATNGVAFAVWPELIDDGTGALRMGFVNPRTATSVLRLRQHGLYDTLTPAGNSAGVIYSDAALAAKPVFVLGAIDWDAGLAAAGTWTAQTRVTPWSPGQPLPGETVDFVALNAASGSSTTSTTYVDVTGATVTLNRRRPQNAVRIMADATAQAAAGGAGVNTQHIATLLRGATDLGVTRTTGTTSGGGANLQGNGGIAMRYLDFPGNALAATYKMVHRTTNAAGAATTSAISMEAQEVWA